MKRRRPKGVLGVGFACFACAATGRTEHAPTADDYPDSVIRRTTLVAGGGLGWRLSALVTPRSKPAPWKIVVITGSPSWAEYWAPVMAELPQDREMVVVDRPGFGLSEPAQAVTDIDVQARALAPLLETAPGQRLLLVGQSYGAAIAALMAARAPTGKVAALTLLSPFLGEPGPTARWLMDVGGRLLPLIPRDLRNTVLEVTGQAGQLERLWASLETLRMPVHVVHGDLDDFAPLAAAERLVRERRLHSPIRLHVAQKADHFLNDGPPEVLLAALEACLPPDPAVARRPERRWLKAATAWLRRQVQGHAAPQAARA